VSASGRPEPVLNAATVASAVVALIGVLAVVLASFGVVIDVDGLSQAVTAVVTAAFGLVAAGAPIVAAVKARRRTTPVSDPRDVDGVRLVRDTADGGY
jgi:hypothetical protein